MLEEEQRESGGEGQWPKEEVGKEFDLFAFLDEPKEERGVYPDNWHRQNERPQEIEIDAGAPIFKIGRPAFSLSRPSVGRYSSADWSPPLRNRSTFQHDYPLKPVSPTAAPIIAHDFALRTPTTDNPIVNEDSPLANSRTPVNAMGSVESTPSLASGVLTSTETTTGTPPFLPRKPRVFTADLVTIRRTGRKCARRGIRITRRPTISIPSNDISGVATPEEPHPPPPAPVPQSHFIEDIVEAHGRELYDKIKIASKLHNTSGQLLPVLMRDLLPALSDRKQALGVINDVRANFDLSPLSSRVDRISLQRALAQMREKLYMELAAAFILPHAPPELPPASPGEEEEDKMSMSMTPSSFETLSRTLPNVFHPDRTRIKAALESREGLYGEDGDVIWVGGVGRMKRRLRDGEVAPGYRGEDREGLVHVFVDHLRLCSNILHGLLHHLYSSPLPLPPRHQRVLSLPCLSLLLRRGRPTRASHLVASSPLHQDFDPLVRLNWEVSILKRVEIYESEVVNASATKLTPRPVPRSVSQKLGMGGGTRRYKEQGVDEILTLKMLQTINRFEAVKGSTMVLATGDAKGGQFNQEGFLGAVREAVGRGWNVELWSFSSGLSRAWRETARREKWDGRFRIYTMDEWAAELVEVDEEAD